MKKTGAIIGAVLLLTSAGCGNSRPSTSDVSKALQDGVKSSKSSKSELKLKKKQADCVAKVFEASKLSDATLTSMVDDHTYKQNTTNDKVLAGLSTKLAKCNVT
ncbi:hypothetical protein D9V37_12370 [Nocardioides mangrovicus]|uniref:Uncharacterized protein n=1 Tax=Nocardioides mangrovicus TaxID=2478913 RepID=A0A3L8P4M9_9ACTN|nr:hypothetical protein [Nocardioides mangrovicus]RLV49328.1 hypothetical protein D9V37_12370 [Nocardioides mangrovicus]